MMPDLLYVGSREGPECHVWRYYARKWFPLPPRACKDNALPSCYDWRNDEPASFALALALAADLLDDARVAVQLHLDFWQYFIRTLPLSSWAFKGNCLAALLADIFAAQTRSEGVPMFRYGSYRPHPVSSSQIAEGNLFPPAKGGA